MLWPPHLISLGNGKTVPAIGTGDICLLLVYTGDSQRRVLTLRDIRRVPALDANCLSVSCLERHNLRTFFGAWSCRIMDGQETIGIKGLTICTVNG